MWCIGDDLKDMSKYEIIYLPPEMRELFSKFMENSNQVLSQVLTPESEKPVVIHYRTRQMTYVMKGQGYTFLDNHIYPIREGDIVFIDQNTSHSFASNKTELYLFHWHLPNDTCVEDRTILQEECRELQKILTLDNVFESWNKGYMSKDFLQRTFSLYGKIALVTGCATGIGKAISDILSQAGADIIGIYNSSNYVEIERKVLSNGRRFYPLQIDLNQVNKLNFDEIIEKVETDFGSIDILINNAGVNLRNMAVDYSKEDWDIVFNVNLKSMFFLSQSLARKCINEKRCCKIIQIASLLSFQGGFKTSGYTTSKHGIIGMTKLLSKEWGRYGINVNAVAPGYIRTSMTNEFLNNTEISDHFFQRISLGRWGKPEDVATAVLFLASPAAEYIQGTTIIVDGGYSD